MRLNVYWSEAAVALAGTRLSIVQAQLVAEVLEFSDGAKGSFLHAIRAGQEGMCYACNGHREANAWEIFVQKAQYRQMPPLRDDHPTISMRGKVFKFPEVMDEANNTVFVRYEDVASNEEKTP